MTQPTYLTDHIAGLPRTVPFIGPEEMERKRARPYAARLGANELVFGPSPKAIEAMQRALGDVWTYGDATSFDLTAALGDLHAVPASRITVGEGIDGLLGNLVRLTVTHGTQVVTSAGTYPTFNYHVAGFGGTLHQVPYRDDQPDLPGLAAKARETGARLVYLANPDNPMGGLHSAQSIADLVEALPDGTMLVLDEAYVEMAASDDILPIDTGDHRIIRLRTFSKAYGLAGARIGYAIGHEDMVSAFDRIRNHFGVNRIAQAGALAALMDREYLAQTCANVAAARARIAQIATDIGLAPLPSHTNFVTVDCKGDADHARAIVAELDRRDVFIRMPFVAPQNRCIRISCGAPEHLDLLETALPEAVAAAR